ncbi:hypothetical protein MTO96_042737 [Rhipicephalus appendiculatus]
MGTEERISLILAGIKDDKWANPLAAQCCDSVLELIDRATMLDCRRSMATADETQSKHADFQEKKPERRMSAAATSFPFKKPSMQRCFNCNENGHISRDCPKPKTRATQRAEEKRREQPRSDNTTETSVKQVNCFLESTGGTLPVVNGLLNASSPVKVCIDTGANVSLISPQALPPKATLTAWTSTLTAATGKLHLLQATASKFWTKRYIRKCPPKLT